MTRQTKSWYEAMCDLGEAIDNLMTVLKAELVKTLGPIIGKLEGRR